MGDEKEVFIVRRRSGRFGLFYLWLAPARPYTSTGYNWGQSVLGATRFTAEEAVAQCMKWQINTPSLAYTYEVIEAGPAQPPV